MVMTLTLISRNISRSKHFFKWLHPFGQHKWEEQKIFHSVIYLTITLTVISRWKQFFKLEQPFLTPEMKRVEDFCSHMTFTMTLTFRVNIIFWIGAPFSDIENWKSWKFYGQVGSLPWPRRCTSYQVRILFFVFKMLRWGGETKIKTLWILYW